jgi:hypothetical protein
MTIRNRYTSFTWKFQAPCVLCRRHRRAAKRGRLRQQRVAVHEYSSQQIFFNNQYTSSPASTTMRSILHLAEKRDNRKGLARGQIVFFLKNQLQRLDTILCKMVDYSIVEHMRFASKSIVETRHHSRGK